jgi:YebC/PmpR family DNA-binding regulatory protein
MAGHSHWHRIRHQKSIEDKKRAQIFSKLSHLISISAKEKGENPETNPALRSAIERAKSFNMPNEKIERAIKKGIGKLDQAIQLEKIEYEAYGPGGIAIIISAITDNKNRTLSEIKQILSQYNGRLTDPGAVKWLFEKKGIISLKIKDENKENLELLAIEAGAENIKERENKILEIYTKLEDLEKTKQALLSRGIEIEEALPGWLAKEELEISQQDKEKAEKLFEALDENEAVQEIYSNLKI